MSHHTKLDENLEGDDNFQDWKYRISLVLEENELDSYIHEEVPLPEGDEAKALYNNKMVMLLILAHDLGTRNKNHQIIINKYS